DRRADDAGSAGMAVEGLSDSVGPSTQQEPVPAGSLARQKHPNKRTKSLYGRARRSDGAGGHGNGEEVVVETQLTAVIYCITYRSQDCSFSYQLCPKGLAFFASRCR